MIDIRGIGLVAAICADETLYIVSSIAIHEPDFGIHAVTHGERAVITKTEIYVVALFRTQSNLTEFEVLVTEELLVCRHSVCLLVGEFRLQSLHQIHRTGSTVPHYAHRI